MAAAVADFRPRAPSEDKIIKTGRDGLTVELEPTTDVLAALGALRRHGQTLVGFAAEHGDGGLERGRGKLERKGLDAVVVNDISRSDIGFDTERERGRDRHGRRRGAGAARLEGRGGPGGARRGRAAAGGCRDPDYRGWRRMSESVYELYRRGSELLEAGDFDAATIPLERARRLEPDKSSIREALGRAYFRSARFAKAAEEFAAVVERYPVNDFAHFCLGRSLEKTGRPRRPAVTSRSRPGMRPDRADYRVFRDRLRAA